MALQSSGVIEASDIRDEFGATNGTSVRFGDYRVSQTVSGLTNMPLDAGIPQSGPIKFSDFYNKKLNVVVDYTVSPPSFETRVNARSDYNANNNIVVIGNFRGRPVSPANTKVWIHTNGSLGSDQKSTETVTLSRFYSSLLTGSWDGTTELKLDVGPSGLVSGAGGDGGKGGDVSVLSAGGPGTLTDGTDGKNGTTAIGIQHTPILITNRGIIRSGGGGGGGGGSSWGRDRDENVFGSTTGRQTIMASGAGGGGGRGLPAGSGGNPGTKTPDIGGGDYETDGFSGTIGNSGSFANGGDGGDAAGVNSNGDNGSAGGAGGGGSTGGESGNIASAGAGLNVSVTAGEDATATQGGSGGNGVSRGADGGGSATSSGGSGGLNGFAFVVNNDGTGVSIINTGTIGGNTLYDTVPI